MSTWWPGHDPAKRQASQVITCDDGMDVCLKLNIPFLKYAETKTARRFGPGIGCLTSPKRLSHEPPLGPAYNSMSAVVHTASPCSTCVPTWEQVPRYIPKACPTVPPSYPSDVTSGCLAKHASSAQLLYLKCCHFKQPLRLPQISRLSHRVQQKSGCNSSK